MPVQVRYDAAEGTWHIHLDMQGLSHTTITHLHAMLQCGVLSESQYFTRNHNELHQTLHTDAPQIEIRLNQQMIIRVMRDGDMIYELTEVQRKLTVFETRMLGQYPHGCLPYPREVVQQLAGEGNKHLYTDLHTHLTSQISGQDLLDAASEAGAMYPVELLHLLGIDTASYATSLTSSALFTPAASEGLACEREGGVVQGVNIAALTPEDRAIVQHAISIPIDAVFTFDALERQIYRLRNPLSKNPAMLRKTMMKVAEDYARQGVAYAELAVTAAFQADWLENAIMAIEDAENATGVTLRMLVGLPRSLSPIKALAQMEKIKFLAQHPLIVGVDFLGYEANKTRNFGWSLALIARFAQAQQQGRDAGGNGWYFNDDFIIRVHAGENGKNPDNVAEVMAIAELYGVRVRVGHAAYGDVGNNKQRAARLAERGLLIIEFNPDSNMAMNNIDSADQCPIREWMDASVPCVLASDGAGIYQTDAAQLVASGVFAGLEAHHIRAIHAVEQGHIAKQKALYDKKYAAYRQKYRDHAGFITAYREYAQHHDSGNVLQELRKKTLVLIAGASGSSWQRISVPHRTEITRGIYMLASLLDPDKVCFAMGRIKREGVGSVLDAALTDCQMQDGKAFDMVGMLSQHQNMPSLAENISHIMPLKGELMSVPHEMTDILKDYNGCALYIGGSAFTRDFIKCSLDKEIEFGVMHRVEGASSQKAKVLDDRYIFHGAIGMVRHVEMMKGRRIFKTHVSLTESDLHDLYEEIAFRITG
jgi:adenosine deaminase